MDVDSFWKLIENSILESNGDQQSQFEALTNALRQRSQYEIGVFDRIFKDQTQNSYIPNRQAFFESNCDHNEDSFDDFQSWLIAKGRAIFNQAVRKPISIAEMVNTAQCEWVDTPFKIFGYASPRHEITSLIPDEDAPIAIEIAENMDIEAFWQLIEVTYQNSGGSSPTQLDLLVDYLAQASVDTIVAFDEIFRTFRDQAYIAELWDAAFFINCGCGDDSFSDFHSWLVAQGKTVFEKALLDPDSLADVVRPDTRDLCDTQFESFSYVVLRAYRQKTGNDEIPPNIFKHGSIPELTGESHEEAEFPTLFPRLMAKLGSCDEWWDAYLSPPADERLNDRD